MKNAIDAAEYILDNMAYDRAKCAECLDRYNQYEQLDDYDKAEKQRIATLLDLYNEIEKYIVKWVKSQM